MKSPLSKIVFTDFINSTIVLLFELSGSVSQFLKKNPHIIIVFVLEKYTDAVSKNIKEYYQSIAPDIDIYVFDYNELKTQFKSIE